MGLNAAAHHTLYARNELGKGGELAACHRVSGDLRGLGLELLQPRDQRVLFSLMALERGVRDRTTEVHLEDTLLMGGGGHPSASVISDTFNNKGGSLPRE